MASLHIPECTAGHQVTNNQPPDRSMEFPSRSRARRTEEIHRMYLKSASHRTHLKGQNLRSIIRILFIQRKREREREKECACEKKCEWKQKDSEK